MLPGDIHFAAVRPAANDGPARKTIVPFQCSLAEASKTVDFMTCGSRKPHSPSGPTEIETSALGAYCVFCTTTSAPPALVVVGTKSWSCASSVFAFMRRVQADFTRDPADFGYWQLRSLAWRAEEPPGGGGSANYAMPPRLLEGRDWDDEESEVWEDDEMRHAMATHVPAATTTTVSEGARMADDAAENARNYLAGELPYSTDPQVGAVATTADVAGVGPDKRNTGREGTSAAGTGANDLAAPFFKANFNNTPKMDGALALPPKQHPTPADAGFVSAAVVDRRQSAAVDHGGGSPPLASTQAPPAVTPRLDDRVGPTSPGDPSTLAGALQAGAGTAVASPMMDKSSIDAPGPGTESEAASILTTPSKDGLSYASDEGTAAVGARLPGATVASTGGGADGSSDISAMRLNAGNGGDGVAASAARPEAMASAAVSEDLAYVHRGSALQSYVITGSVLVAASPGTRARLRVTDKHAHIAKSTANSAVAEETPSTAPSREYLCKDVAAAQATDPIRPKFLPVLMYRCSAAVKALPVRVTCRLRTAGTAVLVWAQVIANPKLSQPLSGVSVLVHLPFSPRQEEGGVKSEPPATWNADHRMLEWVLPASIKRGEKQVMQARLTVADAEVRVAAIPPTAPAMVKCHILDYAFSSVKLEVSGKKEEGDAEVAGNVVRRCRVQCKQQA